MGYGWGGGGGGVGGGLESPGPYGTKITSVLRGLIKASEYNFLVI